MKKIERIRIIMYMKALKVYYAEDFNTELEEQAFLLMETIHDQLHSESIKLIKQLEELL